MDAKNGKKWKSGSGDEYTYDELCNIVRENSTKGCRIFIGCDSFVVNKNVIFASAICLSDLGRVNRYFFIRNKEPKSKYPVLISRILEEANKTIEIANNLVNNGHIYDNNIEVHLDVSPEGTGNKTSKFATMVKGFVLGAGFECKFKPFAWASQSVADRHSK